MPLKSEVPQMLILDSAVSLVYSCISVDAKTCSKLDMGSTQTRYPGGVVWLVSSACLL